MKNIRQKWQQSFFVFCFIIGTSIMYGTINSKINSTPKGAYMPISQLNSILAVVNSLACNNLWLRYYVQVNSARLQ